MERQSDALEHCPTEGRRTPAKKGERMAASKRRLAYTLAVLFAVNTLNFFDRQVPGVVAEPIREEFGLSDAQLGRIITAFVLVYAAVSLPVGRWADVGRRNVILAAGVWVWSAFTYLSALAWSYTSLFALRLGVGVGEASCAPAANSLIGDLFPREQRARAVAVFMLGLPFGLGASSWVSGEIAEWAGWRSAFYVAAAPGLLVGFLCLLLPGAARGGAEGRAEMAAIRPTSGTWAFLRIPTLWWLIVSGALHNFNMYAIGAFLSPFLKRYHGQSVAEAGRISAVNYCVGGLGILLGGWACDRASRRRISGRLEVCALALAVGGPCIYLGLLQPPGRPWAFAAFLLPGCLLFYAYYPGVYASIQDIVEPARRGTAMGIYFLAMYFLGAALGPEIIGRLSDRYAAAAAAARGAASPAEPDRAVGLHDALFIVPVLALILVGVLIAASRTIGRDYAKLQQRLRA
jgi:predicted MFS family arabinose efflux permease